MIHANEYWRLSLVFILWWVVYLKTAVILPFQSFLFCGCGYYLTDFSESWSCCSFFKTWDCLQTKHVQYCLQVTIPWIRLTRGTNLPVLPFRLDISLYRRYGDSPCLIWTCYFITVSHISNKKNNQIDMLMQWRIWFLNVFGCGLPNVIFTLILFFSTFWHRCVSS